MKLLEKLLGVPDTENQTRLLILEETIIAACEDIRILKAEVNKLNDDLDSLIEKHNYNTEVLESLGNLVLASQEEEFTTKKDPSIN